MARSYTRDDRKCMRLPTQERYGSLRIEVALHAAHCVIICSDHDPQSRRQPRPVNLGTGFGKMFSVHPCARAKHENLQSVLSRQKRLLQPSASLPPILSPLPVQQSHSPEPAVRWHGSIQAFTQLERVEPAATSTSDDSDDSRSELSNHLPASFTLSELSVQQLRPTQETHLLPPLQPVPPPPPPCGKQLLTPITHPLPPLQPPSVATSGRISECGSEVYSTIQMQWDLLINRTQALTNAMNRLQKTTEKTMLLEKRRQKRLRNQLK